MEITETTGEGPQGRDHRDHKGETTEERPQRRNHRDHMGDATEITRERPQRLIKERPEVL